MPRYYDTEPEPEAPYYRQGYASGGGGGGTIRDLIQDRGRIGYESAMRSGDIWGNTLRGIGATLAGGIQANAEAKAQKRAAEGLAKQDAAFVSLLEESNGMPAPQDIVRIYGPQRGMEIAKGYSAFASEKPDPNAVMAGLEAMTPPMREQSWGPVRQKMIQTHGLPPEAIPEQYDDQWFNNFSRQLKGGSRRPDPLKVGAGETLVDPETGEAIFTAPTAAKAVEPRVVGRSLVGPDGKVIYRDPDSGGGDGGALVAVMGPDGQPVLVPRAEAVGKRPASNQPSRAPTGVERTALGFYNRARQATEDIGAIEDKIAEAGAGGQLQLEHAPNWAQTNEQQLYRQAQRAFTEARLRKESGQAIPAGEYENDARTYFAKPGDSAKVREQKRRARQVVLDSLAFSSGKAYDEYYGEPSPKPGRPGGGAEPEAPAAPPSKAGAPKQGDRRRIGGQLAEWDGHGWAAVD